MVVVGCSVETAPDAVGGKGWQVYSCCALGTFLSGYYTALEPLADVMTSVHETTPLGESLVFRQHALRIAGFP